MTTAQVIGPPRHPHDAGLFRVQVAMPLAIAFWFRPQLGNQGGPDHLRLAACITLGEGRRLRLDLHHVSLC